MSITQYNDAIRENDDVILYLGHNRMHVLRINKMDIFQTKFGVVRHADLIGQTYGSLVKLPKGYAHVLHITPSLWTVALPHRTQILYATDISLILLELEVKPGSVVIEAGTGSGSLSHAFLRSVYPSGHLHSFDFHEGRVNVARVEFEAHKAGPELVTLRHGDVCESGFADIEDAADAVFLDLPSPWNAIPHAKKALKIGGRICCFSPCIEQTQRTCLKLEEFGFCELKTVEQINQPHMVRTVTLTEPVLKEEASLVSCGDKEKVKVHEPQFRTVQEKCLEPSYGAIAGHTGYLTFASNYE